MRLPEGDTEAEETRSPAYNVTISSQMYPVRLCVKARGGKDRTVAKRRQNTDRNHLRDAKRNPRVPGLTTRVPNGEADHAR